MGALGFGLRPLFTGLRVLFLLWQLKVFLVGIALFAGFAVFVGDDAALVLAFLAVSGGLLTASQLFRGVIGGQSRTSQQGGQASQNDQHLNQLHNVQRFIFTAAGWAGARPDTDNPRRNLLF